MTGNCNKINISYLLMLTLLLSGCGIGEGYLAPIKLVDARYKKVPMTIVSVASSHDIVAIIDPCGDNPGVVDEILLRMSNGQIIVSYSNNVSGDYTRLAILVPGTYQTTDTQGCFFTIDSNGGIINEHL